MAADVNNIWVTCCYLSNFLPSSMAKDSLLLLFPSIDHSINLTGNWPQS